MCCIHILKIILIWKMYVQTSTPTTTTLENFVEHSDGRHHKIKTNTSNYVWGKFSGHWFLVFIRLVCHGCDEFLNFDMVSLHDWLHVCCWGWILIAKHLFLYTMYYLWHILKRPTMISHGSIVPHEIQESNALFFLLSK